MLGFGEVLVGCVLLGAVLACAAAVAWVCVRPLGLAGEQRVLALTLVFTAALIGIHLVPYTLGVGSQTTVLLAAVLAVGGAAVLARWVPTREAADEKIDGGALIGRAAGALAVLLSAAAALALVRELAGQPFGGIDALNFQVPVPAMWLQTGSVWGLHQFFAEYSNATYPHHGNVLLLAAMLPFDSAFLTRLVAVPYFALSGVAAFALARELGAPGGWALLGAGLLLAVPVLDKAGLENAQTDAPMLACLGAGVVFLLREQRTGRRSDLVLAGLGLGLALGTKWYALTTDAVLVVVWALARRPPLRDGAVLLGLIATAGGFWLVRNWVETGDPLFPQKLPPLFDAPADPVRAQSGFTLAHYLTDWDVWRDLLWPQFRQFIAWSGFALAAGAALATGVAARVRDGRALAVGAAALLLMAAYFVTPYSAFGPEGRPLLAFANTRYGLPTLLLAAGVVPWLAARAPVGARFATAGLLLLALFDGLHEQYRTTVGAAELIGAAIVVALAAGGLWLAARTKLTAALAAGALTLIGLAGAEGLRTRANEHTYAPTDPTLAYVERHAAHDARIALAGVWSNDGVSPVLPAFGPRLDNDVAYAGPFVDGMLRRYSDADAFTRRIATFDLLIVGRQQGAREEAWARRAGWRPVAQSARLALLAAPE